MLNRVTAGLRACFAQLSPLWVVFLMVLAGSPPIPTPTPPVSIATEQRKGQAETCRSLSFPQSSGELKYNIPLQQTGSLLLGSAPQVTQRRYHQKIEADRQRYFPSDLLPTGIPARCHTHIQLHTQKHTYKHEKHT